MAKMPRSRFILAIHVFFCKRVFIVKGIQKLKYICTFSTYCECDFFSSARYVTMGLETRRLKNTTNSKHRTNAREIA